MSTASRFVTDSSLDELARRLRFLGYDIVTHRGARLEELFEDARRNGRIVLTMSARRSRQWATVPVVRVPRHDLAGALRAVVTAHVPAGPAWSRCPACNVALHSRSAFEARGEVPGRVSRMGVKFGWCPSCGQWYWPGSHVARLTAWFETTLGRPMTPPEDEARSPDTTTESPAGDSAATDPGPDKPPPI